ncbi:DUF4333 domain-containing protein [Geodermatophilus sp. DF01-2]|uniref:DUF4333 domain-containing protein n=1 Tax=Geodermatophilus sp. DF01-2 TaxID=2559610 RepID=UPI001072FB61|nr:DUF4333 domain-containing protein [Geodermatophilus sp. DF01_2]TFV52775.1 DUF4333 domain-containing protein [Geodermatophilus sp. DF01_2]
MSRPGRLALLASAPVLGLCLAACGQAIEQGELEVQVATTIESEFGVAADISCPGDLDAEVAATTECTATDPDTGEEIALRITVTSVEDGAANFDIEPVE